jgi:mono/diheme cytochrome c family protein
MMTEHLLLGLFQEATPAADTIEQLRQMGVADAKITVMSGMPYEPEMLARPPVRGRLGRITLLGAFLGALTALVLSAGLFLLYPLVQGGQPIVPIPPSLIVLFEVTMLGTMGVTFVGFLVVNRFPVFGRPVYDLRITAGSIGVVVQIEDGLTAQAEDIFRARGAYGVQRLENGHRVRSRDWALFAAVVVVLIVAATAVSLLFFYDVIRIPFPTQMVEQDSTGYGQGPRLAAPAEAVPVQGPVLIAGQPASEPIPATAASLQRGQVLFGIHCALCHGQAGAGDGPIAKYFVPRPADLTGERVQDLPDDVLFLVITRGRGIMPALAENLSPIERWDVINHVHSQLNGGE